MAAIACGGIATGIYTTNAPETCAYVAENSKAQIIFVENESQAKKYTENKELMSKIKGVVQWLGPVDSKNGAMSWDDFMSKADIVTDDVIQKRIENLKPDKCCTLIYTSGTTGPPVQTLALILTTILERRDDEP
jgi:long-chain-fatty-acid--CoA ligase ACSBG